MFIFKEHTDLSNVCSHLSVPVWDHPSSFLLILLLSPYVYPTEVTLDYPIEVTEDCEIRQE